MRDRKGLTLIELTVALALAAGLAVAALTATVNLRRAQAAWDRPDPGANGESLRRLLACDLLHADGVRKVRGGFELRCMAALDPETLDVRHLPAVVAYRVREVDGTHWLTRTQASQTGGDLCELICCGVESISLDSAEGRPPGGRWKPLGETATVRVTSDGQGAETRTLDFTLQ
jgi:prepilin-type N-terminal cleavage/methylation domain-containing protein